MLRGSKGFFNLLHNYTVQAIFFLFLTMKRSHECVSIIFLKIKISVLGNGEHMRRPFLIGEFVDRNPAIRINSN